MGLTGIQIFKFLPAAQKAENSNCKKCGFPTCMAFAMKLAKGEADVEKCPFIAEDVKKSFLSETKKPQIKIETGAEDKLVIGDENVMFRHDKTFVNPCGFSVQIYSDDKNWEEKYKKIVNWEIERVGNSYKIDAFHLINNGGNFEEIATKLLNLKKPLIIETEKLSDLDNIIELIKIAKPLVFLTSQVREELVETEKTTSIIVDGKTPEELSKKTEQLLSSGAKNIVLNLNQKVNSSIIEPLTMIRRSAIKKKFEPLGFPVMVSYEPANNVALDMANLSSLVCKYANLISINGFNEAILTALITLRLNIYTDPQKPLQVEPKLYEIGDVNENSKVIVTTNFALTYFAVANELENLSEGTYLIITDSDGMSVLTAWSANKFTGEIVAKAIKNSQISEKVNHKNLVIPGLVAELKEEIEEEIPEYNIIVGTTDASDLPAFLNSLK